MRTVTVKNLVKRGDHGPGSFLEFTTCIGLASVISMKPANYILADKQCSAESGTHIMHVLHECAVHYQLLEAIGGNFC